MYKLGQLAAIQHLGLTKQAVELTPEQADIYKWLAQQRGEYERAANAAGSVSPELQSQMLTNRNRMVAFADHKRSADPYAKLRLQHYPSPAEYSPTTASTPKVTAPAAPIPAPAVPTPRATVAPVGPPPAAAKSWMGATRPVSGISNAAAAMPTPTVNSGQLNKMRGVLGALRR